MSRRETTASPPSQRAPTSPEEEDEKDNEEDKETRECDAPWKQRPNVVTHTHTAALLSCRERRKERKEIRKAHPLGDSLIDWKERVKERERKRKKEISERERKREITHHCTHKNQYSVCIRATECIGWESDLADTNRGPPQEKESGWRSRIREGGFGTSHAHKPTQDRCAVYSFPSDRCTQTRCFLPPPGNKNKQKERS